MSLNAIDLQISLFIFLTCISYIWGLLNYVQCAYNLGLYILYIPSELNVLL